MAMALTRRWHCGNDGAVGSSWTRKLRDDARHGRRQLAGDDRNKRSRCNLLDDVDPHVHPALRAVGQEAADVEVGACFREGDDIAPSFVLAYGVQGVA